ncbi:MAG: type II secretion system protein M [Gammaproteobacteria bacterium]|nr:type II secretion system protein M [Gammaproteobacteria bacterium]
MNALLAYWQNLQTRERRLILAALLLVLPLLLYLGVWRPLQQQVNTLQHRVEAQQETEAWMQQAAAEVLRLRARDGAATSGGSLLATMERSTRQYNLGMALKRVEPDGIGKVRVQFESAEFDRLVEWLEALAVQHTIQVESATLDRQSTAGIVNAQLVLIGSE